MVPFGAMLRYELKSCPRVALFTTYAAMALFMELNPMTNPPVKIEADFRKFLLVCLLFIVLRFLLPFGRGVHEF